MKKRTMAVLTVIFLFTCTGLAYGYGGLFDDPTVTENQRAIGEYFNDIYYFGDPPGTVSYQIGDVYNDGDEIYLRALDNLSPETYAALPGITLGSLWQFQSLTLGHLAALRSSGTVAGKAEPLLFASSGAIMLDSSPILYAPSTGTAGGWGVWGETYGLFGSQANKAGRFGYRYNTFGFSLGVDRAVGDKFVAGLVTGYSRSFVDFNNVSLDGHVNSFDLGIYGSYNPGPWYLDASFTWARNWYETERYDFFAFGTAEARYHGDAFAAYLGGGYNVDIGKARITPTLSLAYTYYNQPRFNETGAWLFNLAVHRFDSNSLVSRVGLAFAYEFDFEKVTIVPEASAEWAHEYLDVDHTLASRIAGVDNRTFEVSGVRSARDSALLGLGVTAYFANNLSVYGNYDAEIRNHYNSHGFTIGVRYEF